MRGWRFTAGEEETGELELLKRKKESVDRGHRTPVRRERGTRKKKTNPGKV